MPPALDTSKTNSFLPTTNAALASTLSPSSQESLFPSDLPLSEIAMALSAEAASHAWVLLETSKDFRITYRVSEFSPQIQLGLPPSLSILSLSEPPGVWELVAVVARPWIGAAMTAWL